MDEIEAEIRKALTRAKEVHSPETHALLLQALVFNRLAKAVEKIAECNTESTGPG